LIRVVNLLIEWLSTTNGDFDRLGSLTTKWILFGCNFVLQMNDIPIQFTFFLNVIRMGVPSGCNFFQNVNRMGMCCVLGIGGDMYEEKILFLLLSLFFF